MRTHTFDGRKGTVNCDETNRYRYRLYADGSIVDKHDNHKIIAWITSQSDLDVLFKMNRATQQKLLIQHLHGKETN